MIPPDALAKIDALRARLQAELEAKQNQLAGLNMAIDLVRSSKRT